MKFDLSWLTDLLNGAPDADTLSDRLTACGFLVETRDPIGDTEVWDVEVTTNRPDAMNHRGLAREAAVATGAALGPLSFELNECDEPAQELASIRIDEPELCSRYVGRIVRGITMTESPDWLKTRLETCGVRPINAVVDATNYLLLELGQPMHAFDLHRLADSEIIVRRAEMGERLTTLDGEERRLDDSMLVIADSRQATALAGVMGGADSEIGPDTADILIESANFDALSVRRTARKLGMHTEASHRFERGADPEMAATACDAAAAMIAELCGGRVCQGRIDVQPRPWTPRSMELDAAALSKFAGYQIDGETVERIFAALEFDPHREGDRIVVTPPSFRVDVELVPDLYEEVIRHVGYDVIPSRLPVLPSAPGHRHANWELVDRGREAATATGLIEIMTYSFIGPEEDELAADLPLCPGPSVPLDNPLALTQSTMRRSLLPGLLSAARDNLNRGERSLAIFEQGRVFSMGEKSPHEFERLAVALSGGRGDDRPADFSDLKGAVEEIMDRTGFPAAIWRRGGAPWLDEVEGAVIESNGRTVGCAGLLAGGLRHRWDLKQPLYVAELDLGAVDEEMDVVQFEPLPKYPAVVADMTVEHEVDLAYAALEQSVRRMAPGPVESVELVVRYSGKGLGADRVRTTLRLVYRHSDRSLTQDEVNGYQTELRGRLGHELGVKFA
jgi:phenylalanyl-tRNA synthetase beta chain